MTTYKLTQTGNEHPCYFNAKSLEEAQAQILKESGISITECKNKELK